MFLAVGIVWCWGINTPIGLIMFALVIVLAGILQTAWHAVYAAVASGAVLFGIQLAVTLHWHNPNMSWRGAQSSFGDVLAYCTMFGMLGLVSWLYNREMERSMAQTEHARTELLRQKVTLKTQVKERTAELRQIQLEEMQQMYHFAELGQLGVTLLHDLANHLTALTLEVEDMSRRQHAETNIHIQRIIQYLEGIVESTRERLHGGTHKRTFNIVRQTDEAIEFLRYKATKMGVEIEWDPSSGPWQYAGDSDSLSQVVAILTNNAIDAYASSPQTHKLLSRNKRIRIVMERDSTHITIRIKDWGKGITQSERKRLFKPSHSTKKSGLGLGLYIAKQTVEMQFSGTITIAPSRSNTEFIIELPINNE